MKWVTFISYLFLVSLAESKHLSRRYRDVGHHDIFRGFIKISESQFPAIILALFSQTLQKASYEEVMKLTNDTVELAKKCYKDEQAAPECSKPLRTIFFDEICHQQGLVEKYGFTECCGKADPEINECFLSHKNDSPGFLSTSNRPSEENICKEYYDNRRNHLSNHFYLISRSFAKMATLFETSKEYDKVLKACCQEADKDTCFRQKIGAVNEQMLKDIRERKHICSILREFGKRSLKYQNIALLSQKFPKADFPTIVKLAGDIVHIHEAWCKGDTLECLVDTADVTDYICTHQSTISTKVKGCCDGKMLVQEKCLMNAEKDDKPLDLSPAITEFTDNKVCQLYIENKTTLLEKFVYEYGRRYPEFSKQLLLRVGSNYEDFLGMCCEINNPEECFGHTEKQLRELISNTLEAVNSTCNVYAEVGDYLFQNQLLIQLTRKAPQLTLGALSFTTKESTDILSKCCEEEDAKRLVCVEEKLDFVVGDLCQLHEVKPLNKQINKCCEDSYEFRHECIKNLGVDPDYVPEPFYPQLFTLHADLCSADPDKQKQKKQVHLIELIKQKPNITGDQLQSAIGDFTGLVTKCCDTENHEECFSTEGPKLVEQIRAALGEQ
ncbi:albumin-like [Rhineura floridana]|uniref:albumin-like n=1 Tax=Rhineura floridana TaxID=261503 RepID=UPI002AC88DEA|nr:albumin-like [Rhineura floridana]